jgi:hypothetical protein
MRLRARLLRILRITTIALVALLVLAFLFVQGQQYLLRYRSRHLLADFHSLRLKQSTWADAQRLMSHWGAFGHYDGTCTAADCMYFITLQDQGSTINLKLYNFMEAHWPQSYSGITFFRIYAFLGGRGAEMQMGLVIEDGTVERSGIGIRLDVLPDKLSCEFDCNGYALLLSARASDSLNRDADKGPWILGRDEQLAQHPDYKVGRPGGCMNCMFGEVTFTPYASQSDIDKLTTYDLSCLTRHFHPCRSLPDLLPAARDWHLYPRLEGVAEPPEPSGPPRPCDIPVFALGRDATSVLEVKVLSVATSREPPYDMYPLGRDFESAKVQIVSVLKGKTIWPLNTPVDAAPYTWDANFPAEAAEHFETGRSFIVLPDSRSSDETRMFMQRCGVLADSTGVRDALAKGFAQNDTLPHKEDFRIHLW